MTASRECCHSPLMGIACQLADNLALVHLLVPVAPEGTLRASELTTRLLPTSMISQVSPSLSMCVFSFILPRAIGCISPASLLLLFPGSLTSPCRFCILFRCPWHGCHLAALWKSSALDSFAGIAASTVRGSWPRAGLEQQHPARIHLFIHARAVFHVPWLTVFQPVFNIFFSALLFVLPPLS